MKPRSVCSATVFSPRTLTLALGCLLTAAGAQAQDKIRIGFITDMSGLYADVDGKGGALAVQMAVDDFGGKLLGKPIEREYNLADLLRRPGIGFDTVAEAVAGADVVLLLTEWQEYRDLDPVELRAMVRTPNIIDGRNVLDPQRWLDAGWTYRGMGRLAGPAAARAQV